MNNNNGKSKIIEFAEIVIFTLALFGFLMLVALFKGLLVNESGIRWTGIYQVMVYMGIMDLGIIICLTDIVFSKSSSAVRLTVFLSTLYGSSLIYFTGASINPLGSLLNFTIYTGMFGTVALLVLLLWQLYQTIVSNQYGKALADYRSRVGQ